MSRHSLSWFVIVHVFLFHVFAFLFTRSSSETLKCLSPPVWLSIVTTGLTHSFILSTICCCLYNSHNLVALLLVASFFSWATAGQWLHPEQDLRHSESSTNTWRIKRNNNNHIRKTQPQSACNMLFAFLRKHFFETAWVKGHYLHINGKESVRCWKLHLYYFLSSELLLERLGHNGVLLSR